MSTYDYIAKIKQRLDEARIAYERAMGQLENVNKQIKDAGFNNIEELSAKINELSKEIAQSEVTLNEELNAFKTLYLDKL